MLRNYLILTFLAVSAFAQKEIVFVAGPKDHGVPGRHEYGKALTLLKGCIDSAALKGISTKMYMGQPPDASELKNAAVIVLNSSGDRVPKEAHAIFPQDATTDHATYDAATMERLQKFDGLMKKGVGIAIIHYTTWVNNPTGRKYFMEWAGGYYEDGYSKVVRSTWHVEPAKVTHPILNGITTPWTYDEEFFTKERLSDDPHRVTLLTGTSDTGVTSDLAWSIERAGGGRGFVMTGADIHKNMLVEQHRRLILNGIVWAAKLKVPAGGMSCDVTEDMIK
jgi:type 1 glutamine amidotransferase